MQSGYYNSVDEMPVDYLSYSSIAIRIGTSPQSFRSSIQALPPIALGAHMQFTGSMQNSYYTLCDVQSNGQLYMIATPNIRHSADLKVTIDGVVTEYIDIKTLFGDGFESSSKGVVFGSLPYYADAQFTAARALTASVDSFARYEGLPFKSLKIEYRPYGHVGESLSSTDIYMDRLRAFYRVDR